MSLIIASNYKIIVESLWHLLTNAGFAVCGAVDSLETASHEIIFRQCDTIILTDPAFGLSTSLVLPRLHSISKGVPVVLVSIVERSYSPSPLLESSLRCVLPKDSQLRDLYSAVNKARAGKRYITPASVPSFASHSPELKPPQLSSRESEVPCLIGKGSSTSEIARKLSLSVKTISSHKSNIKHRLNLRTTGEIIRYAIESGLVPVRSKVTGNRFN